MARVHTIVKQILGSGLTIYDSLSNTPSLIFPTDELEFILNSTLKGLLLNQPIRTRSKVLKSAVCMALGYPVPTRFRKTKPQFLGQNFDTYVQKANNLQIWNEQVSSSRRYVIIRVNDEEVVTKVKVVTGNVIAAYDTTGTLTHKYQAKSKLPVTVSTLLVSSDTEPVRTDYSHSLAPSFLLINLLFAKLRQLEGKVIRNPGITQERNRGGVLHETIATLLGLSNSTDNGQFPDIIEQLLEIKLQTSSTIDLGLVCPNSIEPILGIPMFRHCDVRYAVVYGVLVESGIRLEHVVLTTGESFFNFFQMFGGLIKSSKLQIPLPSHFFD